MKLALVQLTYVRSKGLYATEKCDASGKLLNQTVRYTIAEVPLPRAHHGRQAPVAGLLAKRGIPALWVHPH